MMRGPAHLSTCACAGDVGRLDLPCEKFVEGLGDAFGRAILDDVFVGHAAAQQAGQAARPRQADVVGEPDGLLGEVLGESPIGNEARVCSLALNSVQRALLLG